MMKKGFLLLILLLVLLQAEAAHLKGGWIQYEYLGDGTAANTSRYRITVRQYLDCRSELNSGQRDTEVYIGIFSSANNVLFTNITVPRTNFVKLDKSPTDPCITGNPKSCYLIDVYATTIDLPDNQSGYTVAVQRCCRISGIANIATPSNNYGITYSTTIPGVINNINFKNNNSPSFAQKDTVIICYNSPFTFDFSAIDSDGDSLSYSFCEGLNGGGQSQGTGINSARPNPPANPPYNSIAYQNPYDGMSPIGKDVTINSKTGLISGIAPSTVGEYVLGACVSEFRNGIFIGRTKKEIHITIADCSLSAANLKPTYITCDGFTMTFQNESTSPVASYLWDFGVKNTNTDISTNPTPTYTYADTGVYTLKLKVTNTGGCQDSTTAEVRIFPGFTPAFNIVGACFLNNYQFKDATTTAYGKVNSWRWNFGDGTTLADTARSKDSTWKYPAPVNTTVSLIVTNSKGCIDTLTKPLIVRDRPSLNLAFKDTLICSIDTLALIANISSGAITWVPDRAASLSRMLNSNTPNPLVYPRDTTRYFVTLNDGGCISRDTVTVNVLNFISVNAGLDTAICTTDTARINTVSDALSYRWTSSTGETVNQVKSPAVKPLLNTTYYVTANLGYCQARDSIRITVAPYPQVKVGADTAICFGSRVNLFGAIVGNAFQWNPTNTLINANTLTPTAGPSKTTQYILTASNIIGCIKPVSDTIIVTVIPPLTINAGRDTAVLPQQPLQLLARGSGGNFSWSPATGLSDPNIPNPVGLYSDQTDSVTYTVRLTSAGGCFAEDQVTVRVFITGPEIFVPTGFTPNGDGKNDVLKPLTVGISNLVYFSIYNRWGQLIYKTSQLGEGWDGTFNGILQPSGTYVFQTEGTDYLGKRVYRKGTSVMIR